MLDRFNEDCTDAVDPRVTVAYRREAEERKAH